MTGARQARVAIYTRKSSEEGLEQEFNSLHAQREACEAYIVSQRELGWKLLPQAYDDGGLSGGSMERPALKRLLDDVAANRIDVIIVYKIDRLTRSLMDFARIVAKLDAHSVSFVSVTQQFNTSSSMGRLTLNMLLSFAQFEREVTAERIRDKFAASKRRGMWMGGVVPLGYDAADRKLNINQREAETVRWLYNSYLELGSVHRLREAAERCGIRSKARTYRSGKNLGGTPLTRGHLYAILSNPVYIGKVRHKDQIHDGQHEAIVEAATYNKVQALLEANASTPRGSITAQDRHLLTGLIHDETGDRLTPSHANKKGKRYRYYVSNRLLKGASKETDGWRLPADQVDRIVVNRITALLADRAGLIAIASAGDTVLAADAIPAMNKAAGHANTILATGTAMEKRRLLQSLIQRITITRDDITIAVNRPALRSALLGGHQNASVGHGGIEYGNALRDSIGQERHLGPNEPIVIRIAMQLRRRGVEARLVFANEAGPKTRPDPALVSLLADANLFLEQLTSGICTTMAELAAATGQSATEISRIMPLAFLAPDIVRLILEGRQPVELTAQTLKRTKPLPASWSIQRQRLQFTAAS